MIEDASATGGQTAACDLRSVQGLAAAGFVRIDAEQMRARFGPAAAGWREFADSWNDLGMDRHMADGGTYRRRRHAVFQVDARGVERQPHQPHIQSRDYNRLNGGVERWFEPVLEQTAEGPVFQRLLSMCDAVFSAAEPGGRPPAWRVEAHQFRIEAGQGVGHPTPEGFHRDGVDWVLVMLVERRNVTEGVTEIGSAAGESFGRFTLSRPGDAVLLDDRRVFHGVTPIRPLTPGQPAYRDVLVLTFAAAEIGLG